MPKPFDVTLRHLLEQYPTDWLRLLGVADAGTVEVVNPDLATLTFEADEVFRLSEPDPWLLHLEVQASYDPELPDRTLVYNTLLYHRQRVPVSSTVLLLRPQADGPAMTGVLRRHRAGRSYLEFAYDVVRVWQLPVESLLSGGPGTLPLAPLTDDARSRLPDVIARLKDRIGQELPPNEAASLWTATYILMGLQYPLVEVSAILRGVRAMRESSTYQAILEEGAAEGERRGSLRTAREMLLAIGSRKLGHPGARERDWINSITDAQRLKALAERIVDVSSWDELMSTP